MPVIILLLLMLSAVASPAAERPDPEAYFQRVMANPHLQVKDGITGEQFCWHAAHAADDFVDAYLAWGDSAWIDQAARYFDWLVSLMATGPDGYRGWIGPYIYESHYWCDVHVGDAILINPMLRFAETVLADTALARVHGERARGYIQLARRDLIEKWDRRGTWVKDGPYGAYRAWDYYLPPGDLSTWRPLPDRRAGLSLPFNKQMDMGLAALRLYRLTGEVGYRQRAECVFGLFKARLRVFEGGYVWNYWEPLGPWDIDEEDGRIRHWVQVHPTRNYQAREVAFVVEAYHTGVAFGRGDIERILHTNLENMWNGDTEQPHWRNAGLGGPWRPQQKGRAGTLWSALADFDPRVRQLIAQQARPGGIAHAYFHQVVAARPVGFARRYATAGPEGATVKPPTDKLTLAAVLPRTLGAGAEALVVCKAAAADTLTVTLHDADGRLLETLYGGRVEGGDDGLEGISSFVWTPGAGVASGAYWLRWQLGDEYRRYRVERR